MRRFLEFVKGKGHLMLLLAVEMIAAFLLLKESAYHRSVFLSSANVLTGQVTQTTAAANQYIGLRSENIALMERTARLEREVQMLRHKIDRLAVDTLSYRELTCDSVDRAFPYDYTVAQVVGNTLFSKSNYITLDIGTDQGIKPDMGVVGREGLVGVIKTVGRKYSKVVPVINKAFNITCKTRPSGYIGQLQWDGIDLEHTVLTHLPKHGSYHEGDSVFTSGFSSIFPEDIFVGVLSEKVLSEDDNFIAMRLRLSTSFHHLKYVYVIRNYERSERLDVEEESTTPTAR